MVSTDEILNKYRTRIESKIDTKQAKTNKDYSREYAQFKQDMLPEISRYEKWAQSLGNLIKLKIKEADRIKIQKFLTEAHINVTPSQALTLSVVSFLGIFFLSLIIGTSIFLITSSFPLLLTFLGIITSFFVFYYNFSTPQRLANAWKLKASSQMVPAILYIVVYMKHTSNLERAIAFASEHLEGPLALDFKKIFYDVEIGKFATIKQSLDSYLEKWREYAPEFVESIHLIESSLYEPSEARRVQTLEKALQVILDGIYEKMLKYSRSIRSPLTNIYMLGIILPTLGLALIPLAAALLGGAIQWQHVFVVFNIIVPFIVFYLSTQVLLRRPGGYGETSILELNPLYLQFKSKKPWIKATFIAIPLILIGLIPFLLQIDFLTSAIGISSDYTFEEIGLSFLGTEKIFDFKDLGTRTVGPFGPIASLLSLFIPLGLAIFFSSAYKSKTKEIIKSRESTKLLEEEFTNSIFQLGNRLGDGTPAEIAFAKVADSTQGQKTQNFFSLVNQNIQQLGMPVERAIFDPKRGAIIYFPSALISTSMRILIESVKKGLKVAAKSLMSISEYVKNIQKINQRLKDLLAEIVSDMRSNMTFLAPLLSGIVVGLSAMITFILNKLQALTNFGGSESSTGIPLSNIVSIFDVTQIISPYFIQLIIGIYIVEITFILTATLVTVNSGKDILKEKYELSKNLVRGIIIYTITALISITALTILAGIALSGIGT